MALEDAINNRVSNRWEKCSVLAISDALSEEDRKALFNALDTGIPTRVLVSALRSEGHKIGDETMNKHRNRLCKCATK
jgi:hypothetical protein